MELSALDHFFWLAGFVGHVALLSLIFVRRKVRKFPFFTSYIAFSILRTILLFVIHLKNDYAYFYAYWAMAVIDVTLMVLVFAEIAWKVFRPAGTLSKDMRTPLIGLGVLSVALAIPVVGLASPYTATRYEWLILRADLLSTVLLSELFAGLTLLSVTAGFSWRTHVGIIARGLGFYSLVALFVAIVNAHFGVTDGGRLFQTLSHVQITCYVISLCYWIYGFSMRVPETTPLPQKVEFDLRRMNAYVESALFHLRAPKGSA